MIIRILKQLESVTLDEDTTNALDQMLHKTEKDTNEEKYKGVFARLRKKKKKPKHRKPHNYYARKNKKKEEKRQHLKNNKGSLNRIQQLE
ncbi:Plasmodium exported protein, unknown function [Plasmodium sp. DRC-Itaito]|nr:Plasmodium exported protein, unknown function [Plasmodium sp. DRC-Itaito]